MAGKVPTWEPQTVEIQFDAFSESRNKLEIIVGEIDMVRDGIWKSLISHMKHRGQNKRPIDLFNEMEKTGNKTVEFEEWRSYLMDKLRVGYHGQDQDNMPLVLTVDALKQIFDLMDVNEPKGRVDFKEFNLMLTQQMQLLKHEEGNDSAEWSAGNEMIDDCIVHKIDPVSFRSAQQTIQAQQISNHAASVTRLDPNFEPPTQVHHVDLMLVAFSLLVPDVDCHV